MKVAVEIDDLITLLHLVNRAKGQGNFQTTGDDVHAFSACCRAIIGTGMDSNELQQRIWQGVTGRTGGNEQ